MTYKAFRTHVHQVAEAMERSPSVARRPIAPSEQAAEPTLPEIVPPVSPPMSQKAKFRAAREAQKREAAAAPPSPPQRGGKPDTSMIDGGEIWMSVLGRQRVRELAALNLKLRSGEISEADARPALEAARREAWSKRLGVRADQLTEEDMNGHW